MDSRLDNWSSCITQLKPPTTRTASPPVPTGRRRVLDLPTVVDIAREHVAAAGLASRIDVVLVMSWTGSCAWR